MKWLAIIILLPIASFSQNKIEGLGIFKVGKTLFSQIPKIADTSEGRLAVFQTDYIGIQNYHAGWYQIANLWIEDLDLSFYHDTLYFITCKFSDSLKRLIELKYGTGTTVMAPIKIVDCITGLKIQYKDHGWNITTHYPTPSKNISADLEEGVKLYDCKTSYYYDFYISDNSLYRKTETLKAKLDKAKKKSEDEKLNGRLKDL